ncbi:putative ester cyclase [Dyadobacter sp. BE34]|uniref:Ester cyclase n=1 Tax=Dyadobacter fermentans TaxID=94254 RepID=A0ABU1QXX3_9BACT|nr:MULTISPECIES: ester cyclase [Dyadobacter]MDR6805995.1 putative ester cyclase [Dyadobacter fermentans]MDR7043735.1 putative ester cyclase [Dyadobacter sp. BE242]MDR7198047.1 putative ester cyclase [Dyadobacter sp. BE34]MDR7216009.1 putative ester cyclase [Dyadobacter sp. BE31]MDR7264465.1 putative ester cyclase [Dyadobacter sp. BE32]
METMTEKNKAVVRRFNQEVIGEGNLDSFKELMDEQFVNRSAPEGMNNGPDGMIYFFNEILRPGMPDVHVTIHQQVAEADLVTTRKTIGGTHTGTFLGIPATGRAINIDVIDIVRVKDGKYFEHWGITSLPEILSQLQN